jgi:hypothetical protein
MKLPLSLALILISAFAAGTWAYAEEPAHAHAAEASDHTLREVMQQLATSMHQIQSGLLTNNRLLIATGAQGIAHHPAPKGGLKPYIKKNHKQLMPTIKLMDKQVHATAVEMFKTSKTASMTELQALNNTMVSGCISCHAVFRD